MIQAENTGELIAEQLQKQQDAWSALKGLSFDDALTTIANSIVNFSFKLLISILVFYIGRFIIRKIYKMTFNVMTRRKMDASLTTFVLSLVKIVLYFILITTIIGILGVETSSFIAIFASAGVAIGMALSGTLQNFAGGVLILLLKPYKVGDYIETQGYSGTVKSIQLFSTIINTIDNKAIIIPNGTLSTTTINNFSLEHYRRVDWTISLSYSTDFEQARKTILEMLYSDERVVRLFIEDDEKLRKEKAIEEDCEKNPEACDDFDDWANRSWWYRLIHKSRHQREEIRRKLADPNLNMNATVPVKIERAPFVGLSEMADSSINIVARAWTHSSNYWPLFFEMNARFFKELPEKGFSFPFPQLDVHLDKINNK